MTGVPEASRSALADRNGEFWQTYMAPIKSAKQQLFVLEYIKDFNASRAYRDAGYQGKDVDGNAAALLANKRVAVAVEAAKAYRLEEVGIDATYVLKHLQLMYEADVLEILREDCTLRPLSEWPIHWRRRLTGIEITEQVLKGTDSAEDTVAFLKKVKWPDPLKILEAIGKHTNVRAFVDQKEVNANLTIQSLIDELTG